MGVGEERATVWGPGQWRGAAGGLRGQGPAKPSNSTSQWGPMGAKTVWEVGRRGQYREKSQDTTLGLVCKGGLPGYVQLGNGARGCMVVARQKGPDCSTGPGMGGQYWLVLKQRVGHKWLSRSWEKMEVGVTRQGVFDWRVEAAWVGLGGGHVDLVERPVSQQRNPEARKNYWGEEWGRGGQGAA